MNIIQWKLLIKIQLITVSHWFTLINKYTHIHTRWHLKIYLPTHFLNLVKHFSFLKIIMGRQIFVLFFAEKLSYLLSPCVCVFAQKFTIYSPKYLMFDQILGSGFGQELLATLLHTHAPVQTNNIYNKYINTDRYCYMQ